MSGCAIKHSIKLRSRNGRSSQRGGLPGIRLLDSILGYQGIHFGPGNISPEDVQAVLEDFVPPSYPTEIELQNLVAVLECTSRSLLPARYRTADRGELIQRVNLLGALARETSA